MVCYHQTIVCCHQTMVCCRQTKKGCAAAARRLRGNTPQAYGKPEQK
ncbi:hypothetical protein GCWU000325_02231 [Alloprevotella tannerae ATCC 51259]|uniref:Uncharacterized protein n=1 Tax=Alloprevotella tannerae ATCC 51259 TaxID=626522 RepID=C9LJ19_9BACT|nr:hypothetical protein GCWU000325_02231 [Alloprevotella tannerae ATCC 51259]